MNIISNTFLKDNKIPQAFIIQVLERDDDQLGLVYSSTMEGGTTEVLGLIELVKFVILNDQGKGTAFENYKDLKKTIEEHHEKKGH